MHQCRRVKCLARRLVCQSVRGETPQLVIHERQKLGGRLGIALGNRVQ
jgi:hypothetical protein